MTATTTHRRTGIRSSRFARLLVSARRCLLVCVPMRTTGFEASPADTRYVPFTQQEFCCTPTSMLMIMYRNGIPLIPAEELGYHFGLTVRPQDAKLFYNTRVSPTPPSTAGYGTLVGEPGYEPDEVFAKLGIPLKFSQTPASEISGEADLLARLCAVETNDQDALLCFNPGVIDGEYKPDSGHVTVFDRIVDGKVRIIDPSPRDAKWQLIELPVMWEVIHRHGDHNGGGIWHFANTK